MMQLTLIGPRRLEWRDVPTPALEFETDALIRPLAVARCDLDLGIIEGHPAFIPPFAIGHEFVGEVVSIGSGITSLAVGDLVASPFEVSCGTCRTCSAGKRNACDRVPYHSMFGFGSVGQGWGGALCDLVRIPFADRMLVRLPDDADLVGLASAGDNMANGYRAVASYLANHPGAPVLVRGGRSASIGLYATFFAVALGSEKVVYWDDDRERLKIAQSLGATVLEAHATPRERFAIGVNASGTARGLSDTLAALAPAGVCTTTFPYDAARVELPLLEMFAKGLTLVTGGENSAVHLEPMLSLVAERQLDLGRVVTRVAGWDDAPEALLEPTPKLVITRQRRDRP